MNKGRKRIKPAVKKKQRIRGAISKQDEQLAVFPNGNQKEEEPLSGGKQSALPNTSHDDSFGARTEKETMGRVNDNIVTPLLIGTAGSLFGSLIMLFFGDIFKSDLPYVKEIGVLELILFIILMIYWGISITCCGKVENAGRKLFWFFVLAMIVLFGGVILSIYKKDVISTNNTPTVDTPIIHVEASVCVLVKDDSVKAVIPIDSLHYVNVKQYLQSSKSLSPKQEANTDSLHKKQNQKQK